MFSNILASQVVKLPTCQQVRFARKTFRLRYAYGEEPLITEDEFLKAKEEDRLTELSYKEIRFALPHENSSPLFDREYDRFSRYMMQGGKRGVSERLLQETFYNIKCIQYNRQKKQEKNLSTEKEAAEEEEAVEMNPLVILKKATRNCEPVVITKKVRRGGATYQVPYPLAQNQSEWFSVRWLIKAARDRPKPKKKLFPDALATELLEAYHNRGKVVKMKDDMHKQAEANKAYAHYRWG